MAIKTFMGVTFTQSVRCSKNENKIGILSIRNMRTLEFSLEDIIKIITLNN